MGKYVITYVVKTVQGYRGHIQPPASNLKLGHRTKDVFCSPQKLINKGHILLGTGPRHGVSKHMAEFQRHYRLLRA